MWSGILRRRVRRTTLISCGCAAALVGVGAAGFLGWSLPITSLTAAVGLLLFFSGWRHTVMVVPAVVLCGLLVGLWRGGAVRYELSAYSALAGQKVTLSGVVAQDATYNAKGQIDFYLDHVVAMRRGLPGQVRVTSFSPVEPKQGDVIRATAKAMPGFGSYQLGMYYATVSVVRHNQSWFARLRRQFSAAVLDVLPEPQASLGLGFLLGIKSQLPAQLTDQLKIVGLTHIVVASGYNLTILVRAARRVLARRSKYQATLAAVLLMVGFVGVTGLSASMVRAALVTSLSLAAWYYGRAIHPVLLLLFAAAMTGLANPLYVWGDLGWYLSFLAFAGVMLGSPLLQRRLFGRHEPPQLAQVLLETMCAEALTVPLTLAVFGNVSVLSLLANLLVTPFVSVAMLTTFVGGLANVLLPGVGAWLALPAQWLLGYMTSMVQWLAGIPWARQAWELPTAGMVTVYAALIFFGWVVYRRTRHDYLGRTVVD